MTSDAEDRPSYAPALGRWAVRLGMIVSFLFMVSLLFAGNQEKTDYWMCRLCGSRKTQVTHQLFWLSRIVRPEVVQTTPLAEWIVQHHGSHAHAWKWYHRRLGGWLSHGWQCGSAPEISYFSYAYAQERYLDIASEREVNDLLDVLNHGDPQSQHDALQEAWNRIAPPSKSEGQ